MPDTSELRDTIHDLGNVLTRILTASELLAEEVSGEQAHADVSTVRDAALAGRELVDRLGRIAQELS